MNIKDVAVESLKYVSPISYMIAKKIQTSSENSDKILENGDFDE